MKEHPTPRHPDLEALLGDLDPEEASQLRALWDRTGEEEPVASPGAAEVEHAYERFGRAVAARKGRNGRTVRAGRPGRRLRRDRPGTKPGGPTLRRFAAPAVAAVLILFGLLAVYRVYFAPVTRTAGAGERLSVLLPDGSSVELNAGSQVRYPSGFGAERSVFLIGEAFFDVVEAERPFVVETFNARIRVLGTRFNVRAWQGGYEDGTTVSLESGRVELASTKAAAAPVVMEPGQTHHVGPDASIASGQVTLEIATAWRRGGLVYKDQRLGVILQDVERRFGVDIRLEPAHLATVRYSLGLHEPRSAEGVIRDLALAVGLRYRETAAGFEMY